MNRSPSAIIFLFAASSLVGCFFPVLPTDDFEYIALSKYEFEKAAIEPGTELKLLAFSGGKQSDNENIYYDQFIVRNKTTGDTMRILAPLISIDKIGGVKDKLYTSPIVYDPASKVTTAVYQLLDSSHNLALQAEAMIDMNKLDTSTIFTPFLNGIVLNQYVVVNKSMPYFNDNRYPAAIGVLHFKENPM